MKGMFERLFFGTYKCLDKMEGHTDELRCLTLYGDKLFLVLALYVDCMRTV